MKTSKNLCIQETYSDGKYVINDVDIYETAYDNIKDLFKSLKSEFGKASKTYQSDKNDESHQLGWVFKKRVKYEDYNEYYTQEVWVSVFDELPKTEVIWEDNTRIEKITCYPHKF